MRNYIFLLILIVFTSCKTTPKDYSNYTFIGEDIKSDKYEIITLIPEGYELRGVYGHRYPSSLDISRNVDKISALPFILFNNKFNSIFFLSTKDDEYTPYTIKYNIENNKTDTIAHNSDTIRALYNNKNLDLVDFKFPEAEKYYKVVKTENKGYVSNDDINRIEKTYNTEEKRKKAIDITTYYYTTNYIKINMPKETLKFKYNLSPNGKLLFFGNEELHKKGYICMYVYKSSGNIKYSSGLYFIRPK